ncbi:MULTISPECIES: hypothetical protein [Gordonibacter]|uniref:Uncharacterized protein n=1 Tax=Gordonibacter faecis TaxID=3047475 RepID=A0ABT7DQ37_9ACTN|nr:MULTISPECIES: hypothetical protein [unclassified Gordonibacter]MDJ1651656.1 hypothetical protein [Gordonibacter sp. KGMB12511]HIW77080.1 hypothetical protein [Candidatus Gordonibacter avicola]
MSSISGADMAQAVCCWIKDHPAAFKSLMHIVHREVDSGNPCVQQGDVMKLASYAGIEVTITNQFRRDRTLWPGIARYMVMLSPRLARSLGFKASKLDRDDVDLIATWHEIVNPNTFFLAKSWKEAKRLVEEGDVSAL